MVHISTGWCLGHPSEKYESIGMMKDIPNLTGKMRKMATIHHQPDISTMANSSPEVEALTWELTPDVRGMMQQFHTVPGRKRL